MKKILLACFLLLQTLLYAEPIQGGTLVFARNADSTLLDPGQITDAESLYVTRQLYDSLMKFKAGSTEIEPGLAKSYEISDDGLTYTFHLREGVYFAPTNYFKERVEMTADDVVFSLKRQFDKSNPYHNNNITYDYWVGMGMDNIVKDVEKIDKYTVKITLKKHEAAFLANMAMDFTGIVCKKYADKLLEENKIDNFGRLPIGTGAFSFVSWKKDDTIILKANKDYWGQKPYLDRVVIKVIPNASVRAAELKVGSIHVMDRPNFSELDELSKNEKIKIKKDLGVNTYYVSMNQNRKEFQNPLVRKAINHAINKEAIVKAVFEGYARVAHSPLPPTIWGYTDDIVKYEYNPALAKELLAKAGYENGFSVNLLSRPTPEGKKLAEAVQADLAKINITANIQNYDFTTYVKKIKDLEHDMAINSWISDNGDPDNFLYTNLSKVSINKPAMNFSAWSNDEFETVVTKAKESTNHDERVKLYEEAQKIFAKEAPWVTIANQSNVMPVLKKVRNFDIGNIWGRRFNTVWLEK